MSKSDDFKQKEMNLVVQSNKLIQAYYETDLNATEHKIVRFAAAKVAQKPDIFPDVVFSVREFLDAAGVRGGNYYSQFVKIARPLSKKTIEIKVDKGVSKKSIDLIPWFSKLSYDDGYVRLKFNDEIKPLISALKKEFTQYNFEYIGDMKSAYTIRLFELLKQYQNMSPRKRVIELEELKKLLGLGNKYQRYSHFKERIIKQAKKELDYKGGLTFEYRELKRGRKVYAIEFDIAINQKQLDMEFLLFPEDNRFVEDVRPLLEQYGISDKITDNKIKEWKKYGIESVINALEATKKIEMVSPGAYISKVLEDNSNKPDNEDSTGSFRLEGIENKILAIKSLKNMVNHLKKSKDPVPGWHIKQYKMDRDKNFTDNFTQDEIDSIWEQNKEYLIEECNRTSG